MQQTPYKRKPRLIIDHIVLQNFKSYAGTQFIGPFHQSFTSIIGPNGSGKSNVIDGLLFVFGRRANKLRQGKIEDLIHKSKKQPNLTEAKVTVKFLQVLDKENGECEQLEFGNFSISRTVRKGGHAFYQIDNRQAHYDEVESFMQDYGINLKHNRFLILQGEIEQISLMKPKGEKGKDEIGFLEYLEEIIGTNKYIPQIETCEELDQQIKEKLIEAKRITNHAQKEMDSMQTQKGDALQRLEQETLLVKYDGDENLCKYFTSQQIIHSLEQTFRELEQQLQVKGVRLQEILGNNKQLQDSYNEQEKNVEVAEAQIKIIKANMKKEQDQLISTREKIKNTESKIRSQSQKTEQKEKQEEKLTDELELIQGGLPALNKKHETSSKDLELVQAKIDEEMVQYGPQAESLKEQIKEVKDLLAPFQQQKNKFKSSLDVTLNKKENLLKKYEQIENKKNQLQESITPLQENVEKLKIQKSTMEKGNTKQRQEFERAQNKLAETQQSKQQLGTQMHDLNSQVKVFQESQTSQTSSNNRLNFLFDAQKQGKVSGIFGRLGDLGYIDPKYDVAVSTAAGALDYIVVDTVNNAYKGVELLRNGKQGTATFIILEKQQMPTAKPNLPQNSQRLIDLITPSKQEILPAFNFALGNTLVVENLNLAEKVAYGTNFKKVVTQQGELISATGTLSGGGKTQMKGKMQLKTQDQVQQHQQRQSLNRDFNLDNALKRLQKMEQKMQEYNDEIQNLSSFIDKNQQLVQQSYIELTKLSQLHQTQTENLQNQEALFQKAEQELQQFVESIRNESSTLKKEQKHFEAQLQQLDQQSSDYNEQLEELQASLGAVGGETMQNLRSMYKSYEKNVQDYKQQLVSNEMKVQQYTKEVEKLKLFIKTARESIEKEEQNLKTLLEDQKSSEYNMIQIKEELDGNEVIRNESSKIKKDLEEKVTKYKKEMQLLQSELQSTVEKVGNVKVDRKQQINDSKKFSKDFREKIERYQKLWMQAKDFIDEKDMIAFQENISKNAYVQSSRNSVQQQTTSDNQEDRMEIDSKQVEAIHLDDEMKKTFENLRNISLPISFIEPEIFVKVGAKNFMTHYMGVNFQNQQKKYMATTTNATVDIVLTLQTYDQKRNKYQQRLESQQEVEYELERNWQELDSLNSQRHGEFMEGFNEASSRLKEIYQTITMGGNAELELVDSLNPFSDGISFTVRPPKKSWKSISNLSGGEKTLSSLSLVFALHYVRPTPLYVMDEIDAALDFRNVSIIARYIKERTKQAQFVIISLRNQMFELATNLVGICKIEDQAYSLMIQPSKVKALQNSLHQIQNQTMDVN